MTAPPPKRLCQDLDRALQMAERAIVAICREMTTLPKITGGEHIMRELLRVHATHYAAVLSSDLPAFDLRATLVQAGLTDAVVLDSNEDIAAESNVTMCGHIDLDVFLLKNNAVLMKCDRFVARPLDDVWQVYGAKSST